MSTQRPAPRYTGIRTFAGLEHVPLAQLHLAAGEGPAAGATQRAEIAIVGIPFDTATSWRPGARFAPEAIRSASVLLRPWHPGHGIEVLRPRATLDAGDIAITPGNAARSAEQIAASLHPLCAAGTIPVVLGGDHSVALGELRAHASAGGPLPLLLFDAHADTWDEYYGERLFHGTFVRRAIEERLIDPSRSLIAGLRGSLYAAADLDDARELGLELMTIEELRACTPELLAARVRERCGDERVFLGFDIDVVDPSAAPATGTPEVGGLTAAEALAFLRGLAGIEFAGFDLVEVCPAYDSPGQITLLLAANIAYEMLALAALGRRAAS
jgi:agmatinase